MVLPMTTDYREVELAELNHVYDAWGGWTHSQWIFWSPVYNGERRCKGYVLYQTPHNRNPRVRREGNILILKSGVRVRCKQMTESWTQYDKEVEARQGGPPFDTGWLDP